MRAEKRAVAGHSVLAALAMTTLKIAVGVTTSSLGILSEAAHSVLDLVAALVTFFSVRVADKPADAETSVRAREDREFFRLH
jgi:divalent metal cation (Fe/Co/Zn/Cd) transporter